jgi:hypothetical protein
VTDEAMNAAVAAIQNADQARDATLRAFRDARDARDAATLKLKSRLSGLREELNRLIGRDDHRWAKIGFSRPVDGPLPGRVQELTATPGLAGRCSCNASRRRAP